MTSQNPRDPGKISQAFPSRARSIMQGLRQFDQEVRKMVDQSPESQDAFYRAANRVEARGGSRSEPSPSRSSAAMRQRHTGVTENHKQQGWMQPATAIPHLCFPPQRYPEGCGPGSQWLCRCDAVWVASGVMWEEYPQSPSRREVQMNVERWQYVSGGQLSAEEYREQEGFWDWRPLGPYFVRLARALIDNQLAAMEGRTRDGITWQELG